MLFGRKRRSATERSGGAFWERHAQHDPLWAILSDPEKQGRKWDLREFFDTGAREISTLLYRLAELDIRVGRGSALDFGCGVGRLTQALAAHFDRVVGVDISPTMVRLAGKLNRQGDRVRYVCNTREDLGVFDADSFQLIYSDIVLQHVEPAATRRYLADFFRVLETGGLLVFQLPSHPRPASGGPAARAMAADAYRARVTIGGVQPATVGPSTEMTVTGTATNVSSKPWSQHDHGGIRLGNHWLDQRGETMLIQDDGRVLLPPVLGPGETFDFTLTMKTPAIAGDYQCEIDLVHEAVCWFADRGSNSARFDVHVGPGDAHSQPDTTPATAAAAESIPDIYDDLPPQEGEPGGIPMFSIHRDEVVKLLRAHGDVVQIDEDTKCGREWVGYRYFVRK